MVQAPYCVAPNLFEQLSAARLLGVAPGANDTLAFSLEGGSAIIYGATAFPQSTQREAAHAFVNFLRSEAAHAVLRKKGLDPA